METLEQSVKYSRLTIKKQEWHHRRYSGVFIVNLENILHLFLVIVLLTNAGWGMADWQNLFVSFQTIIFFYAP